ncbi:hypothetical protein A9Q84_03830 [Halobacteriovorax marinus]|uniref:Methyltransferase n=1 Tax=Halobacteriovorax marinus TaxID=97084 RepID=A0A1Y5FFR6_9BACT|nr:hypothetical protein A9Q84_03830 [Halobacteriovorax marinus]
MSKCPLCRNSKISQCFEDKSRAYYLCDTCKLIFVPENSLLNLKEEREIYDLHENDPSDPRYREFMERMLTPLRKYISGEGLDFGCGPGPVVAPILKEEGIEVSNYDPIFFPDNSLLEKRYQFVVATEVIEHIYESKEGFEQMLSVLAPYGGLGIMTSFYPDDINKFKNWGYMRDPTHVRFFSQKTFEWMANKYQLELEIPSRNVVIFKKGNS